MQAKNETFRDFLRRTDELAVRLGKNLQDLPEIMDISRASLFSYRTGKRPITSKAWRKLEQAEREAGIFAAEASSVAVPVVRASAGCYETVAAALAELGEIKARVERLEGMLRALRRGKKG